MKYPESVIPVCDLCKEDETKLCLKCGVAFCAHFSSTTDIRFCANCLDDFRVVETIEIKTTERQNEAGEVISRRRQICKNLRLEGTDWLFESTRIQDMTDDEILASVEYHGAIKSLLINEREDRKLARYKKLSGIRITSKIKEVDNRTSGERKTCTKSEKKAPDANSVAAALNVLLGAKIDPAVLAAALQKMKEK